MTREEAKSILYQYSLRDMTYPKEDIDAFEVAIKALEQEPRTEWIPVSERLPERWSDVLVSTRDLDVDIMCNCGYRSDYIEYSNVLAWQPLPEPYQPLPEPYKEGANG